MEGKDFWGVGSGYSWNTPGLPLIIPIWGTGNGPLISYLGRFLMDFCSTEHLVKWTGCVTCNIVWTLGQNGTVLHIQLMKVIFVTCLSFKLTGSINDQETSRLLMLTKTMETPNSSKTAQQEFREHEGARTCHRWLGGPIVASLSKLPVTLDVFFGVVVMYIAFISSMFINCFDCWIYSATFEGLGNHLPMGYLR